MNCTHCGAALEPGVSFCTNCGAPIQKVDEAKVESEKFMAEATADEATLGASLESAVQANQGVVDSVEAHAELAEQAAARWAEAEAEAMNDTQFTGESVEGFPEAPAGYVSDSQQGASLGSAGAAGAAAAAAGAAAAPFYQQDVSPNAHYSSQRTYEQNAYGQTTEGPAQRPSYGAAQTQQTAEQPQTWAPQSATKRAFAMVLYVSGILGILFALIVRDKDEEFVTHHLNNCVVIMIGMFIGAFLSAIAIGFIVMLYLTVMMIMGIVSAYNGNMNELPLIGKIHIVK